MKLFVAELRSLTPYAQGKYHEEPKLAQELHDAYKQRTALEQLHTAAGEVYIPPKAFHLCLSSTASYTGDQIPGKGKERYTKHYDRGVICSEPVMLGVKADTVRIERIFTELNPQRPGSRGWVYFPVIDQWAGELQIMAVDDIFTPAVIERHLRIGGLITGIGVWRPERKGSWGKFQVVSLQERPM